MPNFSGIWTTAQQFQARGQNLWPAAPGAPTIGTATAGTNNCASVTFTAPGCTGRFPAGISSYTAISTPGCITASGASSPVTVTGLTTGQSYTFRVRATGANGLAGSLSGASNSITATVATSAAYTTPGTYSWVAPAGVTSVAAVAVGGGSSWFNLGGRGGGLGYRNNISVVSGNSYTVVVGSGGSASGNNPGGCSYFINTCTVRGGGAPTGASIGPGGTFTGGGGGNGGGWPDSNIRGGGGAGGYSGNGGAGGSGYSCGSSGSGGGGGGGGMSYVCINFTALGGAGGGVGIFGQGSNGSGGFGAFGVSFAGGGGAGSSGTSGNSSSTGSPGSGGSYGGGGGVSSTCGVGIRGAGGGGAVRIVWCIGGVRGTPSFPSTNVGAP